MTASQRISNEFAGQTLLFPQFEDRPDGLPVFLGQSLEDHIAGWKYLNAQDRWIHWRQAAIAAKLERTHGQRTDCGRGPTPLQQFCQAARIGAAHCSRLAKTYRVFDELLDTGIEEDDESTPRHLSPQDALSLRSLLADDRLCFKHFLVAANYATRPVDPLRSARDLGWSANEMARLMAKRKKRELIDAASGDRVEAADDDDDPRVAWRGLPEQTEKRQLPGTRALTFPLTKAEYKALRSQLRDLSAILGTDSDLGTILAIVDRAHLEWVPRPAAPSDRERETGAVAVAS